ncbi:NAD-dependent epimerase/dehydratase family protein [Clostridiales bacterium]|nr:NAD-dependent epimerase/dehydratase family protein [Clostridiales bacterium]
MRQHEGGPDYPGIRQCGQQDGLEERTVNILVTGAKGMVGTALVNNLKNIRDGKNRTRPGIQIDEIYAYDIDNTPEELNEYCSKADFVFNLAGVNRPKDQSEFMAGNFGFASTLLDTLKKHNNKASVMLSSSIQATLIGRYGQSDYGKSKLAGEELFFQYGKEQKVKIAVYRFPNLMGHSRPNYNSAVSTFCNAIANDLPYTVSDQSNEVELLYINDLVEGMLDLLEGKEQHCEYDGLKPVADPNGKYCYVPVTHKVTLGEIIDLLQEFKQQPVSLLMPKMPEGSFAKKLFSLYLTYLPKEAFRYQLKMNCDNRGSFTELVHTEDCGQVSINISKPGITKGQHWHNSKWEQFIVVHGHGLIQERNINTNEMVEFEVSGDKIEAIYMIPGWTHNIINLSETEDLVTVMTCNEVFNPGKPDTFGEPV